MIGSQLMSNCAKLQIGARFLQGCLPAESVSNIVCGIDLVKYKNEVLWSGRAINSPVFGLRRYPETGQLLSRVWLPGRYTVFSHGIREFLSLSPGECRIEVRRL